MTCPTSDQKVPKKGGYFFTKVFRALLEVLTSPVVREWKRRPAERGYFHKKYYTEEKLARLEAPDKLQFRNDLEKVVDIGGVFQWSGGTTYTVVCIATWTRLEEFISIQTWDNIAN